MSDIEKEISKVLDAVTPLAEGALNAIKGKAEALAVKAEAFSKDVANDILDYNRKILLTLQSRAQKEISAADADLAIKNWKTAMKSALKKVKVFTEWELYDQFWGNVSNVFGVLSALLGEFHI